jgi:hypothetical protein
MTIPTRSPLGEQYLCPLRPPPQAFFPATTFHGNVALSFVIPSAGEGFAVPRTFTGNTESCPATKLSSRPGERSAVERSAVSFSGSHADSSAPEVRFSDNARGNNHPTADPKWEPHQPSTHNPADLASPLAQNPFHSQQILLGIHPDRIERSVPHVDTDPFLQQP